jgi:hypothetical protein
MLAGVRQMRLLVGVEDLVQALQPLATSAA